jgi:hypothetical protein
MKTGPMLEVEEYCLLGYKPCSPLKVNRRFGGTHRLQHSPLLASCFHTGFLLGLFFDPEDGGDMFLRNVG